MQLQDQLGRLDEITFTEDSARLTGSVAAVVAGTLIVFDNAVSQQHRSDVQQTLLLGQLAATAKVDRHREPLEWHRTLQATLEQVGWVVGSSSRFTRYQSQVRSYSFADMVQETFKGRGTPQEMSVLRSVLGSLRDMRTATFTTCAWECPSHSGGLANVQVALCTERDQSVQLNALRMILESARPVARLAAETFGAQDRWTHSQAVMTLNEAAYGRLREAVRQKLGERVKYLVSPVDGDGPS